MKVIPQPYCSRCGEPAAAIDGECGACRRGDYAFDFARSALLFNDPLREIIHHLKYADRVSLAKPLGDILRTCFESHAFSAGIIVPVPLHKKRQRERGYNQAELIAERLGLRLMPGVIRRRKNTPSQTGLSRAERRRNLEGAFQAQPVRGTVLVIDDVYTTGATI